MCKLHIHEQLFLDLLFECNRHAFAFLHDTYSPALHGSFLDIIEEDKELAARMLEEIFVHAWGHVNALDSRKQKFFIWMLHVARRLTISAIQQLGAWPRASKLEEISRGLRFILKHMDKGQRYVIELTYYKGYSKAHIARMLNISADTVENLLQTGLRQLQVYLNKCYWE